MLRMFYDYIDSGSWTETTYRENTSDFKDIRFRQKVLVNMEGRSLETKMIGQDVKMPVAIAPKNSQKITKINNMINNSVSYYPNHHFKNTKAHGDQPR